jgi:hypothetical protein
MKTKTLRILVVTFLIAGMINNAFSQSNVKGEKLIKGKNLNNWVFYLRDHSVDPAKVFTLNNGVVHITGNPFGYMRTRKSYSDYKLHVEYRWPQEATNSGVFVHIQPPDTIWPTSIECQLQAGHAGDFACVGATDMKERIDKTRKGRMIGKMAESSEKPVGEWNSMDITCKGNTIEVIVNGVLQNRGTEVNLKQGFICLQSEGKDVEFRNVVLAKLQ